ncbi:Hypothetical protein POVN_LOCUS455 [uncultured virus]|nr:Hypothetical protein POVN_LOCUS455 [uncultured virus]
MATKSKDFFGDRVIKAEAAGKYIKVTLKGGKLETGNVVLSGSKTMWGNGERSNKAFIYVPSARVAGTEADVTAFLRQNKVSDAHIRRFLDGAYRINNWNSTAPQEIFHWRKQIGAGGDPEFSFINEGGTFVDHFTAEIAQLEARRESEKAAGGGGARQGLDFARIAYYAGATEGSSVTAPGAKKGRAGAGTGKKKDIGSRLQAAKGANEFLNVTSYTNFGTGSRAAKTLPNNAIRISTDMSSPYSAAFFTHKAGQPVSKGPVFFLVDLGMSEGDATRTVNSRVQSGAGAGVAAPLPLAGAAQQAAPLPLAGQAAALPLPLARAAASPKKVAAMLPAPVAGVAPVIAGSGALPLPLPLQAAAARPVTPGRAAAAARPAGALPLPLPLPGRS